MLTRAAWAKVLLPVKSAASSAGVGSLISPCVFTKAPLQPAAFSTISTTLPQCSGFAASQLMSSTARVVQTKGPTLALKAQISGIQRATSSSARRYCTQQASKPAAEGGALGWVQMLAGLGVFLAADKALKMGAAEAGISFPAPLIGMFGILTTLTGLSAAGMQGSSDAIIAAFRPALVWLQRWLPMFYVAPLVVLPVAAANLDPSDLAKLAGIVVLGLPFSLYSTAALVLLIRSISKTTLGPIPPTAPMTPYTPMHLYGWLVAAAAGLGGVLMISPGTIVDIPLKGPTDIQSASGTLFLMGATVAGLVFGSVPPTALAKVMPHPVVTTALCANIACLVVGVASGGSYFDGMKKYLTKGANGAELGAGDVLMSFLGVVILSFGFHIYGQRALLHRHFAEVIGCAVGSAFISMIGTCAVGRLLQLPPDMSLAAAPRAVTVALALPIAENIGVPAEYLPVTAAAVVATGLLGAATCQRLLNFGRIKDPVTRGMSTAGSCHGLGTAALAAKEPEALPFCALAYGLIGISGSCWASVPLVRDLMRTIAGSENSQKSASAQP